MLGQRELRARRGITNSLSCFADLTLFAASLSTPADLYPRTISSSHTQPSIQNNSTHKNLPIFGEATPTQYHGGQPTKTGFHMLAKMGITIVVDLRGSRDSERKMMTHLGMQYAAIPWACSFPKDKIFAEFLILLRKNPDKKIFVHCRFGDDRTAMMVAPYRMAQEG